MDLETHPFTPNEIALSENEGWHLVGTESGFQLQRLDDNAILSDDLAAWKLVGNSNQPHHRKALEFLKDHSPAEYAEIQKYSVVG